MKFPLTQYRQNFSFSGTWPAFLEESDDFSSTGLPKPETALVCELGKCEELKCFSFLRHFFVMQFSDLWGSFPLFVILGLHRKRYCYCHHSLGAWNERKKSKTGLSWGCYLHLVCVQHLCCLGVQAGTKKKEKVPLLMWCHVEMLYRLFCCFFFFLLTQC